MWLLFSIHNDFCAKCGEEGWDKLVCLEERCAAERWAKKK